MTYKTIKLILAIGILSILGSGISSQAIAARSLPVMTVAQSNQGKLMAAASDGDGEMPDEQEISSGQDQDNVQAGPGHVDRGNNDGETNDDGARSSSRANPGRGRGDGDGETNDGRGNAGRGGVHQTGQAARGGHNSKADQGERNGRR